MKMLVFNILEEKFMEKKFKDLLVLDEYAYVYGFLIADGSIHRTGQYRKAKISFEINERDESILYKMASIMGDYRPKISHRTKDTNFKDNNKLTCLRFNNTQLADELEECGVFSGKKSNICTTPIVEYHEQAFFRGLFDGDGSLGFTSSGVPFISIVTASEDMKNAILQLGEKLTKTKKVTSRNKRDNVYNIMWTNEDAITIAKYLYGYETNFKLDRKYASYLKMLSWVRTKPHRITIDWDDQMDAIIMGNTPYIAAKILGISQCGAWRRKQKLEKLLKDRF